MLGPATDELRDTAHRPALPRTRVRRAVLPGCVDDAAKALGLAMPLTRALVAELQLAELIAVDGEE
jgi:hypothetical protein